MDRRGHDAALLLDVRADRLPTRADTRDEPWAAPPQACNQSGVNGKTVLMTALNLNHQTDSHTTSSLVNHMPNPTAKRHNGRPAYLT